MSEERYLTFALGKGRLAKKTLELFEQIGITCDEMKDKDTRKLIFVNEEYKLRFFLAKSPDVPTYVEYGAADIGVVGKDTILEENRNVYEVLDLGFGKCRMCVCGPASAGELLNNGVVQILSFGPALVTDGQISVTENEEVGKAKSSNPRTAIGIIDKLHYVFMVSDGRTDESKGLSLREVAEFMISSDAHS